MPLKITTKPAAAKATITKELKENGKTIAEEQTSESPPIAPGSQKTADTPWCQVGFEAGYTHNLGNFQSARIGVHLTIPCQHHEIDQVFEVAKKWVNDRMETLMGELASE